ncbi:zinc-binding dehydrogenase [Ruminococcus sp. OA3]|nr:zinc-binding dehydrogenase [Ruminococcus sp. OA3]
MSGTTVEERVEFIEQITKDRGADVVIECVGRPQMFADSLKYVRKGARSCLFWAVSSAAAKMLEGRK